MEVWKHIYPNVGAPTKHTRNEKLEETGLNLVLNVVFENLGESGVIFIDGSSSDYLLVYKTTFINSKNIKYDYYGEDFGGAIFCKQINCVQIGVCSYGAYCSSQGAHSYVYTREGSNQIFESSLTQSTGANSVALLDSGTQIVKSTNLSHCSADRCMSLYYRSAVETAMQNFTINCNISGTSGALFSFDYSISNIFRSIYIDNAKYLEGNALFETYYNKITFTECIIKNNTCHQLFGADDVDRYAIFDCVIDNPVSTDNGETYGRTTDSLELDLSFLSTKLCDADKALVLDYDDNNAAIKEETVILDYGIQNSISFSELGFLPLLLASSSSIFSRTFPMTLSDLIKQNSPG